MEAGEKMTECMMERFGGCCCNCRYLAKVNLDCSEQREKGYATSKDGCICHIQIGWACIVTSTAQMLEHDYGYEQPRIYWRGDTKHGRCVCYEPLKRRQL